MNEKEGTDKVSFVPLNEFNGVLSEDNVHLYGLIDGDDGVNDNDICTNRR